MKYIDGLLILGAVASVVMAVAAIYLKIWDVTLIPVGKLFATAVVTFVWALIGAIITNG